MINEGQFYKSGFGWRGILRAGFLLLAAMLLLSATMAKAADKVVDLRFGEHENVTRFVVEMTRKPAYQIFTLSDPYRVVIDMPEMNWEAQARPIKGFVSGYRHGLFRPGVTRIVVDSKEPISIEKHFILGGNGTDTYRLVVDLKSVTKAGFANANRKVETTDWKKESAEPVQTAVVSAPSSGNSSSGVEIPVKPLVVIDAGHGGPDPGAIGGGGTYEKMVTLAVAKQVKKSLEATGKYRVKLTRDRDFYIPLRQRYRIAEEANANLFVSLHADNIERKSVRGASVYTLSERSSDKEAAKLATKENKSDIIVGVDLSGYDEVVARTLLDFEQRATMELSWHFAEMVVNELGREIKLLRNTHRFAGFAVLKSPTVPSILIELGYLSNRQDEKLLKSPAQHQKIAKSLTKAIDAYFERQIRLSKS